MSSKRQKDYRIRDGKVYARITYTDSQGKRRDVMRLAASRAQAKELAAKMRQELKDHGPRVVDADKLKFETLAGFYEDDHIKAPVYHEGRKVSGLRSERSVKAHLRPLKEHFGRRFIKTITPTDVEKYKAKRLATESTRGGKPSGEKLTIASVHRELALLRAIFNYARREGWLVRSPFERLRGIISKADERQRDRVLSFDEEQKLLAACVDRRAHLRPILICALDTGMRKGEILKLAWRDVDMAAKTITIVATNSKTARPRTVAMTARLWAELIELWKASPKDPAVSVFGIKDNFKNAFAKACEIAGVEDFHFHDTRHTFTTRLVETNALHSQAVMRITGHSQPTTFARYVNTKDETARRGAEALEAWQAEAGKPKAEGEGPGIAPIPPTVSIDRPQTPAENFQEVEAVAPATELIN